MNLKKNFENLHLKKDVSRNLFVQIFEKRHEIKRFFKNRNLFLLYKKGEFMQ